MEVGIPSATWPYCNNSACNALAPGGTGAVTGATISAAISGAQVNGVACSVSNPCVVQLRAGIFTGLTGFVHSKSGVALRGQGADQTQLVFSTEAPSSCGYFYNFAVGLCNMGGSSFTTTAWTGGFAQGTARITLSSTAGITPGMVLFLTQSEDSSDGYPATGDVYLCYHSGTNCASEGGGQGIDGMNAPNQLVKVTNVVDGTHVDIDPPISFVNFRTGPTHTAGHLTSTSNTLTLAGIENLSIDQTAVGQVGIEIVETLNCWVKGVRTVYNGSAGSFINHYEVIDSMHTTLTGNYLFGPTSIANTSYPMSIDTVGSILIENNIFHGVTGDIITNGPMSNSVVAYNFFAGVNGPGVLHHGAGEMMNLFEGNVWPGYGGDVIHGTRALNTVFRNAMVGHRYNAGSGAGQFTQAVSLQSFMRFMNLVGNVMGDSFYNTYETNMSDSGSTIYSLGYYGDTGVHPALDSRVKATLFRWGNWDSISQATRWCGNSSNTGWSTTCSSTSEVPSTITNFANPVPSTETLPASFYRASKPSWWPATKPWPAIGPDVSGGNISNLAGHAHTNPAADCYFSKGGPTNGSGGPLTFNADACYGQ